MANELPPGTPEVDDPLLISDLIRLLSIKGAIGRLPLADIVIPTVSLGDVVQPTVEVRSPAFRTTDIFSQGVQTAQAAGTLLADTGQLAAGTYDVLMQFSQVTGNTGQGHVIEWRNAANNANLATWEFTLRTQSLDAVQFGFSYAFEFGTNERLRVLQATLNAASSDSMAVIFARLRT